MDIVPTEKYIIVEPIEKHQTDSGLYLPEMARDRLQTGIVYRGSGEIYFPSCVVLYARHAGLEFQLDGKKLLVLKEEDVLAVIRED